MSQVSAWCQEWGFSLSPSFIETLEAKNLPKSKLLQLLLDTDLRVHAVDSLLPVIEVIQGPLVFQVTSVKNIAQPPERQDESSQPRLLQVRLCLGQPPLGRQH